MKQALRRVRTPVQAVLGNVTRGSGTAWAWYRLAPQRWSYLSDTQREQLVDLVASRYAALAPRRIHLRVTSRPYPVSQWARELDSRTPDPLPGPGHRGGDGRQAWYDRLEGEQRHLHQRTLADKEVYLGVELKTATTGLAGFAGIDLSWLTGGALSGIGRGLGRETGRSELRREVDRVTQVVTGPGLDGSVASAGEVEFLVRRSVGLGLPHPEPSPAAHEWDEEEVLGWTDHLEREAGRFGRSTLVRGFSGADRVHERHVVVLSLGRFDSWDPAAHGPWMALPERLGVGVEWSVRGELLPGQSVAEGVGYRLRRIRDQQRHYAEHGLDVPTDLARKAGRAQQVEEQLTDGTALTATRLHGWCRLAVTGRTEAEALERARHTADIYADRGVVVGFGRGGQAALAEEFVPCSKVTVSSYQRRMPVQAWAAGLPTVTSQVGDRTGPYLGYTVGADRRAVMFASEWATEVEDRSGLSPIIGAQGAGKSAILGSVTVEAVLRGIPATVLDPSGPLAALCDVPALREHARHVDLLRSPPGTLSPWAVIPSPVRAHHETVEEFRQAVAETEHARKMLASDVVRMLLPPQIEAAPETPIVVQDAVRQTGGSARMTMWSVVDHLRRHDRQHGQVLANYLEEMAELPQSRLFFAEQRIGISAEPPPAPDDRLVVLTLAGITLPDLSVDREHWSAPEQMSVPLLHLAAHYTTRRIYGGDMADRKVLGLDEAHYLGHWASGRALFQRLTRDTRKWNLRVLASSQDPHDLLGLDIANHLSTVFVGRIEDEKVAKDALRMLRVPVDVGYEAVVAGLSQRPRDHRGPFPREFLMRDDAGNVEKIRVDLAHRPDVLEALTTNAGDRRRLVPARDAA